MNRDEIDAGPTRTPDELAVDRYRYLLRTAPPETLERAHAEAFERLSPDQRGMVLESLAREVEPAEARGMTDEPRDLARLATRAELREPGTIERVFGARDQRSGFGGGWGLGGGLLPVLAGAFIGTSIANAMFGGLGGFGGVEDASAFEGDPGGQGFDDPGGRTSGGSWDDVGEADAGATGGGADGGDFGGDFGTDFGGDFGDLGGF